MDTKWLNSDNLFRIVRNMKRLLAYLSTLLISLHCFAESKPRLLISGLNSSPTPPYTWYDYCEKKWEGSTIHLLDKSLNELNVDFSYLPPISYKEADGNQLREALIENRADAMIMGLPTPYKGVLYSKAPIVSFKFSLFYSKSLGPLKSLGDFKQLTGIYPDSYLSALREPNILAWADNNNLSVIRKPEKEAKQLLYSGRPYYYIDWKFNTNIERNTVNIHDSGINSNNFYFVVADRPPWNALIHQIDKKLNQANNSGLINRL